MFDVVVAKSNERHIVQKQKNAGTYVNVYFNPNITMLHMHDFIKWRIYFIG